MTHDIYEIGPTHQFCARRYHTRRGQKSEIIAKYLDEQVILRWLIQRGVIIACKSTHLERIKQNFEVFDFELTNEDMEKIKGLDKGDSLFFNHQDPNMVEWFDSMVQKRRK